MGRWSQPQIHRARDRRSGRLLTAVTMAAVTLVALLLAGTAQAGAATPGTGYLRVGHFASATGPVDVYIDGASASTNVAFEQVTNYATLTQGTHTVSVRPAGSPATSAPLVSTTPSVASGTATTVALVADSGGVAARTYADDLTAPPAGKAKLRVVPAISNQAGVDVFAAPSAASGQPPTQSTADVGFLSAPAPRPLFGSVGYGAATPYVAVPAGTYDVQVRATGSAQLLLTGRNWPVLPDTVATIVVLMGPSGPTLEVLRDAAGAASLPAGGMATGAGGTAGHGTGGAVPLWPGVAVGVPLALGLAGLAALAAMAALGARRRTPGRRPARGVVSGGV